MKKIKLISAFITGFLIVSGYTHAQPREIVEKHGIMPYNGTAKILVRIPGPNVYDTINFVNGVATYKQDKYDGEIGWIYATDIDRNMVHYIILEKGTITITATKDSLIFLNGTPDNDALFNLDKEIEPLRMKMKTLSREMMAQRNKGENEAAAQLEKKLLEVSKKWWDKQEEFALNSNNLAGLNYVNKLMGQGRFSTETLKKFLEQYKNLSDKTAYKNVERKVGSETRTDVGAIAPTFTLVTDKGEQLSLSSIKKRLVIIDFWASWCSPCRKENPNLISLYSNWKDKGLEIISVSVDKPQERDKWLKAINEDKLTWLQVLDEKGTAAKDYGVASVPKTFLVDESGKIVAKNLRGEELNNFVAKFLD
ncbi:MAG: TlpA disulfide reductase family protein [Bacteroidales bacterium]|nr:AhpC/TSA family protein [Bacteroidales bacterium]MDD2424425.1 TlpA disulfide reductase family protein [Bacteroidales bacterium]MDD3989007.1 TlpA disulfide reductase family protein [Bacteroidales bacterium]MDD4638798.1 TlpA disulfide reductase family protein [Bacteroidales bacterium]